MQPYSIQGILDWLMFKGLLSNPNIAQAKILCDLNIQPKYKTVFNTSSILSFLSICGFTMGLLYALYFWISPEKELPVFLGFTVFICVMSLLPFKSKLIHDLILAAFIAISFETGYLFLTDALPTTVNAASYSIWIFNGSLLFLLICHLFKISHSKFFYASKGFVGTCAFLFTLCAFIHPGLVIAAFILLMGYRMVNLALLSMGMLFVGGFSSWLIIHCDWNLYTKALILVGFGLTLFTAHILMQNNDWECEG